MTVAKQNDLRANLKKYFELVWTGEQIIIPRRENKNVVILSEAEYKELERAKKNAEYLAKIDRAISQKEAGTMQEHELIEV